MEEIGNNETEEKTIIAYFSAIRNMEQGECAITEAIGGELFQLEFVDLYTNEV